MKRDPTFKKTHDAIVESLTSDAQQFKVERIDKKVSHYKARQNVQPSPSRGESDKTLWPYSTYEW